jgi:type VI secretion system protein ImpG
VAERDTKRRADGILAIDAKPLDWLFKGRPIRGLRTVLTLSEKAFASEGELYLYATVLSRFMAVFATMNSFHKLEVVVSETGRRFQWEPVTGLQPLI